MNRHGRRDILRGALALGTLPCWARLAVASPSAEASGRRLVVVLLRGGLDGLSAVPVPGDAAFADARGPLAQAGTPWLPLEGPFALHAALPTLQGMRRGRRSCAACPAPWRPASATHPARHRRATAPAPGSRHARARASAAWSGTACVQPR